MRSIKYNYNKELAKILSRIAFYEREIEEARCNLAENEKFIMSDVFRRIDRPRNELRKGYLTTLDMRTFLGQNYIPVAKRECRYLILLTNKEKNNDRLSLTDFLDIFLPKKDQKLRNILLQREKKKSRDYIGKLPFYIEENVAKFLELELNFFREIEGLKIEFMNINDWNSLRAFKQIDTKEKEYIDFDTLKRFMTENENQITKDDYDAILRRINKDTNQIITKNEFCDAILPNDLSGHSDENENSFQTTERIRFNEYPETKRIETNTNIYLDSGPTPRRFNKKNPILSNEKFTESTQNLENQKEYMNTLSNEDDPSKLTQLKKFIDEPAFSKYDKYEHFQMYSEPFGKPPSDSYQDFHHSKNSIAKYDKLIDNKVKYDNQQMSQNYLDQHSPQNLDYLYEAYDS